MMQLKLLEISDELGAHKQKHTTTKLNCKGYLLEIETQGNVNDGCSKYIPKNVQFVLHKEVFVTVSKFDCLTPITIDGETKSR